jgi:TonB family protein
MYTVLPVALIAALLPNSPVAAAPSHPTCTTAYEAAHIVHADTPDAPALAKLDRLTGTATIRVNLSETGRVLDASVMRSAGTPILDRAALQVAKSIVYAPETQSCEPRGGSYAVEIEYDDP